MTSLRQRFIEDMQVRNFSLVTQASYTREVSGFARYFNKSPELLGPEQIRAYQIYLTNEKKLGVVSISVATSALRFLYRVTLKKNWCMADMIPAPKVPKKLPIILSPEEVVRFLDCVAMRKHRAILTTCYAAGLRISEAVVLTLLKEDAGVCGRCGLTAMGIQCFHPSASYWFCRTYKMGMCENRNSMRYAGA